MTAEKFSWLDFLWYTSGYEAPAVTCARCGSPPGRPCFGNGWMRRAHPGRAREAELRDAEARGFLMGASS